MLTYRYSRGSRIFYYIIGVPFALGLLFTPLLIWILSEEFSPVFFVFFGGMTFCLGIYFFRGIFVMARSELIIGPDVISHKAIWKTNTLQMNDILGYRVVESRLHIIPKKGIGKKKIVIDKNLEGIDVIKQWIMTNLNNIDTVEAREELSQVLADPEHGFHEEMRIVRLLTAKRVSSLFNVAGIIIAIWIGFAPTPYKLASMFAMAFPILTIFVASSFRGLITISERTNSKMPTMMYGFLSVCLALLIRGLLDFDLLIYSFVFWINVGGLTVAMLLGLMAVDMDFRPAFKSTFFGLLLVYSVLVFSYSVGSVMILNCEFDSSKASVKNTKVVSKNSEIIKIVAIFRVIVVPWSDVKGSEEITVTRRQYKGIKSGDTIGVALHPGMLGIPWYDVVLNK